MYFFKLFSLFNTVINLYLLKTETRKSSGKDERYEENTDLDVTLLHKIRHNELKKNILETLLDNKTNEITKIYLIKSLDTEICDSSIKTFNLNNGNLFMDFNFVFEDDL